MQLEYYSADSLTLPRLQTLCSVSIQGKQVLYTRWLYCCYM